MGPGWGRGGPGWGRGAKMKPGSKMVEFRERRACGVAEMSKSYTPVHVARAGQGEGI